jgi:GTP-binding protein LepA
MGRQQFDVAIQASVNGKVVARETLKCFRKNVLVKSGKTVGGGDVTRKQKLLQKQKEGKKMMKRVGEF